MAFGPCLQRPRQSTESTRTTPTIPLLRSSSFRTLRTAFEPRFLQSPLPHTSTWTSCSLTLATGLGRARVVRAPFARALAFFAFFFEMASSGVDPAQYTTWMDGDVSWTV